MPGFLQSVEQFGIGALGEVNESQMKRVQDLAVLLPKLKESRLPGPKVNQSEYDKVGLTGEHCRHVARIFYETIS